WCSVRARYARAAPTRSCSPAAACIIGCSSCNTRPRSSQPAQPGTENLASSAAMRALALAVALLASAAALAGCEAGYIARAAYEEGRLLWRRKTIDTVLARGDLPPEVRARLETVLKVREFARDRLGLNVGNAYTS